MIDWVSNWAEAIIIAVIIGTIIEMILPAGSSKKYIKVVVGVYILFTMISPVFSKFTGESIAVSNLLDISQYINEVEEKNFTEMELQKNNQDTIQKIYISNLKSDMKNKLEKKGYEVYSIDLVVGQEEKDALQRVTVLLRKKKEPDQNEITEEKTNSTIDKVNEVKIEIGSSKVNTNIAIEKHTYQEKSTLTLAEKTEIKQYISEIYEINPQNIIIP